MKKMQIKVVGAEATIHNSREESLVTIVNDEIRRLVEDWVSDAEWRLEFEGVDRNFHWRFEQVAGSLSAMYFMGMTEEPIGSMALWRACKDEADKRMDAVA